MIPREINPDDVRPGDRVRWQYRGAVVEDTVVRLELAESEGWVTDLHTQIVGDLPVGHREAVTVTLLDRQLPPIPTDDGTVIRHKRMRAVYWYFGGGPDDFMQSGEPVTRKNYDVLVPEQVDQ